MIKIEDEVIKESYLRLKNIWKVGKEIGLSGQNVHKRLVLMGVNTKKNYWTKKQKDLIIKCYKENKKRGDLNLEELSKIIGKNKHQICRFAKKMNLTSLSRQFNNDLCLKQARKNVEKVKNGMAHGWGQARHTKKQWVEYGDKKYFLKSSWEVAYANFLEKLKTTEAILEWEYEPHTFWFLKIMRGVRSFTPDFKITKKDGSHEWHEVKGYMDQRSQTKLKRMKKYYPEEKVVLINGKSLKALGLIK